MNRYTSSVLAFCLVLMLSAPGGRLAAADPPGATARIGEPAPAFALEGIDGAQHRLADHEGKIVVLQWINADCPFIVNVFRGGVVKRTLQAITSSGDDVVFLAVDSTANKPREEVIEGDRAFLERYELDFPVLVDYDGAVGKQYDARTTPQVFVIDREGILRYHGEFTDDPTGRKPDSKNRVVTAVQQIRAGQPVNPSFVRPWGCSVKYKPVKPPSP